jgi:hypothetical protein
MITASRSVEEANVDQAAILLLPHAAVKKILDDDRQLAGVRNCIASKVVLTATTEEKWLVHGAGNCAPQQTVISFQK